MRLRSWRFMSLPFHSESRLRLMAGSVEARPGGERPWRRVGCREKAPRPFGRASMIRAASAPMRS